jgi:hypothetical protein
VTEKKKNKPAARMERATLKLRGPGRRRGKRTASKKRPASSGHPQARSMGEALAPAGRRVSAALSAVAPYVSKGLMTFVRVPAALIAIGLDLVLDAGRWVRSKVGPLSAGVYELATRTVTPVRTLVVVCAGASVALVASQFIDYRGIAIGAPGYEGEIEAIAPAPFTDLEPAGSAHAYALIPLAAIAVLLSFATARGRWRLGRAVGLIGLAGILVGVLVDAPQGLDAGDSGVSYLGTDARLIEGFWAQMAASATLLVAGPLLGLYAKRETAGDGRRESRAARARKRDRNRASKRGSAPARRPSGASA